MGNSGTKEERLIKFIHTNNYEKAKEIINNSEKSKNLLKINDQNDRGVYLFLAALYENKQRTIDLITGYAKRHNLVLELNAKDSSYSFYPILIATIKNNTKAVETIIKYANENNINLILNDSCQSGNYPLLSAITNQNIEIIKSIIKYAEEKDITLKLEERNNDGFYPLLEGINKNNPEIIQLLLEYADRHNIVLKISDKEIIDLISKNYNQRMANNSRIELGSDYAAYLNSNVGLNEIKDMDKKIFHILCKYKILNKLEFTRTNESGEFYDNIKYYLNTDDVNEVKI